MKCIIAKYQNGDIHVSCRLASYLEATSSQVPSEPSAAFTKERLVGVMQRRLNVVEPYLTQWLVLSEFVLSELQKIGRYLELRDLCDNLRKPGMTGAAFVIIARVSSTIHYLSRQFSSTAE